MKQISHKRGDTLSLTCTWTDPNGTIIPLTGYTITSQVRVLTGTPFVDDLIVSVVSESGGIFTLSAVPASTVLWPITSGQYGRMFCDVQFSKAGVVVSTETFEIVVLREITQ